jgi:hypothetical protein
MQIKFSTGEWAMIEALDGLRRDANALDGGHAQQDKTYGAISDALEVAVTTAITDAEPMFWTEARAIAKRLCYEAVNNGENISYQVALWNGGFFS